MADIKVVIQLQDTIEDEIKSLESPSTVNNVSIQKTGEQFNTLSTKSAGANLKSWAKQTYKNGEYVGSLSLADGYVGGANTQLIEQYGYNGYVFGAVPESKQLAVTLEVVGKYIDSIIVYGDRTANQFPTKAYRDGNPNDIIYSDDPVWAIKFDQQSTSHTITFLEWNRANYNACITYVAELKNELTLDKSWIKSLESLSQSTGQPKEIYYGVTPNRGNLNILDIDGELLDYINDGIINPNNLPVDIYANSKKIQSHICPSLNYKAKEFICDAELTSKDSSSFSQTINLKDYRNSPISLKEVLVNYVYNGENIDEMLVGETSYYDVLSQTNVFLTIDEYLQNIRLDFLYFYDESPSTVLNWVCEIAQISLVEQVDGKKKFISLRPMRNNNRHIVINKSKMFSNFEHDIIVNNIYNKVNITSKDISVSTDNVFDKTYKLKTETGYGTYWYDVSAIGLNAVLNKYESDAFLYSVAFFDTLSYKDNEFYDLSSAVCLLNKSLPRSVAEYGTTVETNNTIEKVSLSFSDKNKDEYLLPTNFGTSSITLTNADSPHDNKEPYVFAMFFNINPFRGTDNVNYGYDSVNLTIQATKYKVEESINSFGGGKNEYSISNNPFMSNSTKLTHKNDTKSMKDVLANNILHDYEKGLKTATVSVGCLDYYYSDGSIAKSWSNGEILDVGDVVSFEDEKGAWIITGRNFRYAGVPMLDLELQEVKKI